MKVTLILNKIFNNDNIILEADTYRDIVSALLNIFPSTLAFKKISIIDGDRLVTSQLLDFSPKNSVIHIQPQICGGLNSGFDSLGNLFQFYGTTTAVSTEAMALTGLNKRILDSSLFGKSQTAFDVSQRASNRDTNVKEDTNDPTTGFGSLNVTSIKGQQVPLHFGLVRTSGAIINQYIKHIQRGGIDKVSVVDYV